MRYGAWRLHFPKTYHRNIHHSLHRSQIRRETFSSGISGRRGRTIFTACMSLTLKFFPIYIGPRISVSRSRKMIRSVIICMLASSNDATYRLLLPLCMGPLSHRQSPPWSGSQVSYPPSSINPNCRCADTSIVGLPSRWFKLCTNVSKAHGSLQSGSARKDRNGRMVPSQLSLVLITGEKLVWKKMQFSVGKLNTFSNFDSSTKIGRSFSTTTRVLKPFFMRYE